MLDFLLSMVETEDDAELVTKLFNKYRRLMFHIAFDILHNKQDAEDAVSDAFVRLIKNLDKVRDAESPETRGFITIVVKNTAIDIYNKNKSDDHIDFDDIYDVGPSYVEEDYFSKYDNNILYKAINRLHENYRNILLMKYFYDMSISRISDTLGISVDATKQRIHRAEQSLLKELSGEEVYEQK